MTLMRLWVNLIECNSLDHDKGQILTHDECIGKVLINIA